jgi:hypothetical protein
MPKEVSDTTCGSNRPHSDGFRYQKYGSLHRTVPVGLQVRPGASTFLAAARGQQSLVRLIIGTFRTVNVRGSAQVSDDLALTGSLTPVDYE